MLEVLGSITFESIILVLPFLFWLVTFISSSTGPALVTAFRHGTRWDQDSVTNINVVETWNTEEFSPD